MFKFGTICAKLAPFEHAVKPAKTTNSLKSIKSDTSTNPDQLDLSEEI